MEQILILFKKNCPPRIYTLYLRVKKRLADTGSLCNLLTPLKELFQVVTFCAVIKKIKLHQLLPPIA